MRKHGIPAFAAVLFFVFCSVCPVSARTDVPALLQITTGKATIYGAAFKGRKTANGQRYNPKALTAAHRTLPFGSVVKVTNLRNGREVMVRINDRGPFGPGRIIDLSRESASRLNMLRAGVVDVQLEVVGDRRGRPTEPGTGFYLSCTRAGRDAKASVEKVRGKLGPKICRKLPPVQVIEEAWSKKSGKSGKKHVGMGPFRTFAEAEAAFLKVRGTHPHAEIRCFPLDKKLLTSR